MTPAIFGLSGPVLTAEERAFFSVHSPAGYILFGRNCVDPQQLRALTDELRALAGLNDLLILIDQEGGRVARLGPPHWPAFPAAAMFDRLYDCAPATAIAAARANAQAMGLVLRGMGITADAAPMLEVRHDSAHDIIGDRAFGSEPMRVAALGRAMMLGLRDAGIAAVIKHFPGYGRARSDAHHALPVIDAGEAELENDLAPFAALAAQASVGMVAHATYPVWDAQCCASQSATIIHDIIRKRLGFDGLLMTDAIEMEALAGTMPQRACAALAAGCDVVLHCTGELAEAKAVTAALDPITDPARERLSRAMALAKPVEDSNLPGIGTLIARRDALMNVAA